MVLILSLHLWRFKLIVIPEKADKPLGSAQLIHIVLA